MSSAPFRSAWSWRCLVVCRPRPSFRSSPTGISSRPASELTSVDLPTPDDPISTIVRRHAEVPVELFEPFAGDVAHRMDGHAHRDRFRLEQNGRVVVHVELCQDDDGLAPLSHAVAR